MDVCEVWNCPFVDNYYGWRCTKCDQFFAFGCAPWDEEHERHPDEFDPDANLAMNDDPGM